MDLTELNQLIQQKKEKASRSCMLCKTYKSFQPNKSDNYKNQTLSQLKEIADIFREQYNTLRKNDAPTNQILTAKENRTTSLDLIDMCSQCNKENEKVKANLQKIQQIQ